MKKKFKDTKIGQLLAAAAPTVLEIVGDTFPPAKLLTNLLSKEKPELLDSEAFKESIETYELELNYHLENTKGARGIYTDSKDITDSLAKRIMNINLPTIVLLVIINIACVKYLDSTLLAVISNIIGMTMQKLFEERSTVTNFFFGSSKGSKNKDIMKLPKE